MFTRRSFTLSAIGGLAAAALPNSLRAESALKQFNIGYQKTGILVVTRNQQLLEKRLGESNIAVKWVEFPSGPPLLEALNTGAIDFGYTGDSPPIFAQAASANLLYVATQPTDGNGSAILVKQDSPINSLADLKGKTLGFTKGSSAHNLTIKALKSAGLTYADITPAYLSPADAGAAFAKGAIDAWTIWDPFYAIAEKTQNARVLVSGEKISPTNSFLFANRTFAAEHPSVVKTVLEEIGAASRWAQNNKVDLADALAGVTGVPVDIQKIAADRASYVITPVSETHIASQQQIADTFYELKLIPKPITVRDAVWAPPQS